MCHKLIMCDMAFTPWRNSFIYDYVDGGQSDIKQQLMYEYRVLQTIC